MRWPLPAGRRRAPAPGPSLSRAPPGTADSLGLRGGTTTITIDGERLVVVGDIVLSVQGITLKGAADLAKIRGLVNGLKPGETYTATVLRAGRVLELTGRAE